MDEELDPEQVEQFTVYGAYGEVMLQLQLLEMRLHSVAAFRIKPGSTLEQGMERLAGWQKQPMGRIADMLDLPEDMKTELLRLVGIRNRLAHNFYEDHPLGLRTAEGRTDVLGYLATVHKEIERLDDRLGEHLSSMGVPSPKEVNDMLPDELRMPEEWFEDEN